MVTSELTIVEQLTDIYFNHEHYHRNKMSYDESIRYFRILVDSGNILYHIIEGEIVGYVEFWRITMEQLQRIRNKEPFSAEDENISDGEVLFVSNFWVSSFYRNGSVFKSLRKRLIRTNEDCESFAGEKSNMNKRMDLFINRRRSYGN